MTEQTFLAAILAEPSDDGPRLAYADWLMERGDPRGEFIRVQVELATAPKFITVGMALLDAGVMPPSDWKPKNEMQESDRATLSRFLDLRRRERELLEIEWADDLPAGWILTLGPVVPNPHRGTCLMRRGFIAEVHCTPADWMTHGPALVRACPIERYRPVGVEPRPPSNGWYEDDIGTELFNACASLGAKEGYFVRDPWERISMAAVKWARG